MTKATIKVTAPTGINVEKAEKLSGMAVSFKSVIEYTKGSFTANAKSVLSILASQVMYGDELEFTCEGEDEEEAMQKIKAFFA
ncbi:MAG: HPr family phosphocarrier protein [Lachnospiraceae bacterium]|nr:HPr family phosphocarrier protein [Lachnospiraceae bacterium]